MGNRAMFNNPRLTHRPIYAHQQNRSRHGAGSSFSRERNGNSVRLPSINPHIITHSNVAPLVLVPLRLQIHTATKTSAQLKVGGADGDNTTAPLSTFFYRGAFGRPLLIRARTAIARQRSSDRNKSPFALAERRRLARRSTCTTINKTKDKQHGSTNDLRGNRHALQFNIQ